MSTQDAGDDARGRAPVPCALLGEPGPVVRAALARAGLQVVAVLVADPLADVLTHTLPDPLADLPADPPAPSSGRALPVPGDAGPGPPRLLGGLGDALREVAAAQVRAVVLPASSPLADGLPALLGEGAAVLLPDPAPWEPDLLRRARQAAADPAVAVLLTARHEAWAQEVARETGRPGPAGPTASPGAPVQLTVRGWPRGAAAAAELVDLVRAWCGDVLAVAAAPAPLPASALPDGPAVAWALLTAGGTTVLVAHEGAGPRLRLSFPDRRLSAGPGEVGREGGAEPAPGPRGRAGVDVACAALATAARRTSSAPLGAGSAPWPWPADLADLLPTARVVAALRSSAASGSWVELG